MKQSQEYCVRLGPWLAMLVVAGLLALVPGLSVQAAARATQNAATGTLPPVDLDALDPYRWSVNELALAPGQTIRVTNRGVLQHTFTVREWGIEVDLPTLETIEVTVPSDAQPGEQYTFLCSEPGHQSLGQEGTITIVTPEDVLATQQGEGTTEERVVLETRDDFTWSLPAFDIVAGQFIEVHNPGVLEHHFVVDEWGINETISAGEVVLVQVPEAVEVGQQFTFYCSVPGHRAGGEEGVMTVVASTNPVDANDSPGSNQERDQPDLGRFFPEADALGTGWKLVRQGNARAVLPEFDNASAKVFPGEGRGATYVGPEGSRATILVLPFDPTSSPTNQVEDAILGVQLQMMTEWDADLGDSGALNQIAPPQGCDVANRAAGVTRVYTLPAGSTVCQLRSAGIAIFVAVEGEYADWSGVEAADQVVARLLQSA
jgi:plastocyanin